MHFCTTCGYKIEIEGIKFCPQCGAAIVGSGEVENNMSEDNRSIVNPNSATYEDSYMVANTPAEEFNLFSAWKSMFKKYAQFSGRSRRSEYWYATLANSLVIIILYLLLACAIIPMAISTEKYGEPSFGSVILAGTISLAILAYIFIAFIPAMALTVRRLHDTGRSGWFYLLNFIPYVGSIILIVFLAQDSQRGTNGYGHNPKGNNGNWR